MNIGAAKFVETGRFGVACLAALLVFIAAGAWAWEQPSEWSDLGMVSRWKEYDTRFYRVHEDAPFMDTSQFGMNQIKEYGKTREYSGRMDGIGLETFLARDADEQAERRKAADRELKFIVDFRQRIETQVQRTRERQGSGWGTQISDMTVIGDCLGKLRNAVALDPSNPYAWHVLAYFSGIVGDRSRAMSAFDGAEAALAKIPEDQLEDLRAEVALDRAWLERDLGRFEAASASLKKAAEYGITGTEPRLLQGLIAAQTGRTQIAVEIASALRNAEVRAFPPNLTSTSFNPEMVDVNTWRKRSSNYLQSWILALTWLQEGNVDMAAASFGSFSRNDLYPQAQRFWNDAGRIYEVTGRRTLAHDAWSMARICNPYVVYFVYKPYAVDLGQLTGRPGAVPYFLGFDSFFLAGSRLAYCADLVNQASAAEDDYEKQELGSRALDELEICQASGIYSAQAQVLKGQVYYLMGDLGSALLEVEAALKVMESAGDKAGIAAVLQGLSRAEGELSPTDVANFYSQSGASGGRWIRPEGLDQELAGLRQAYADDPSDRNRHDLARFLIRHENPDEGRDLAKGALNGQALSSGNIRQLSGDDLALVLEADRKEGDDELALALVRALEGGAEDPWNHAVLWIYAGFICLDSGDLAEARVALERAQELDPGNQALRIQLAIMGQSAP